MSSMGLKTHLKFAPMGCGGLCPQQRGIRPRGLTTPHEPGAVQALPWLVHSLH